MLKLTNIRKAYTTGDFTQVALDDVSVSFRDNEFVSILGPSGSGKTTLLNIIGGLDHYDSGNIIIDGISTEEYKDRDWDTYRNNRIGFVFQSYNLIPHQTVLSNVELALTLSGVSRDERRTRATEALEKVGLAEHINKKPSQLSGGQMQRVAIARALINDPEILLADEPTGALDSKTSVQIMDLLTEIANDRLVIMVTHNPDLAEQYSNRIVNLSDGHIISDSNPFNPSDDEMKQSEKPVRRTAMSFLTALSLSFNNLMTKKGRTIMTAFAGSIGIIGIAAILALANGVNAYIKSVEEETLSEYPLQIMSSGLDMTALLVGAAGGDDAGDQGSSTAEEPDTPEATQTEGQPDAGDSGAQVTSSDGSSDNGSSDSTVEISDSASDGSGTSTSEQSHSDAGVLNGGGNTGPVNEGEVGIAEVVTSLFGSIGSNDLASLKEFLDGDGGGIDQYVNAIEYKYNVAPQIYSSNIDNLRQVNPDHSLASLGLGSTNTSNSLMSMTMSTDVFFEMPRDPDLYQEQYEMKAGRWPENYNELVLVTTSSGRISDFMLYTLGLRDSAELDEMIRAFSAEEEVEVPTDLHNVTYDQIMNVTFKLVNAFQYYTHDDTYNVWVDKYDDNTFMRDLVSTGEDMHIVGIVRPKDDATATMLSPGLNYPASLVDHIVEQAAASPIVQDQISRPDINVFTDKPFGEEDEDNEFDMQSLFSINTEALQSAFTIDQSKLNVDMSNALNLQGLASNVPNVPPPDLSNINTGIDMEQASRTIASLLIQSMRGYWDYNVSRLTNPDNLVNPENLLNSDLLVSPSEYLQLPEVQAQVNQTMQGLFDTSGMETSIANAMQQYVQTTLNTYMTSMSTSIQQQVSNAMRSAMQQLSANMSSAVSIDSDAFANAFQLNMDEDDVIDLITSMMTTVDATYDGNLTEMGYADMAKPSSISIYPLDFNAKSEVIRILDDYNSRMESEGQDDKVITYTDIVGTLMASVTEIVNMISAMLIAFVAISLVVSSIMIGVITYISVLERKKEIGILRAIGASKLNISEVFNAETVIEGLIAGLLGVIITYIGSIPANAIVLQVYDVPNIVSLPIGAAAILIGISVLLTFIAGLLPASSASRKDPVEALRSE